MKLLPKRRRFITITCIILACLISFAGMIAGIFFLRYPLKYKDIIAQNAIKFNIEPSVVCAIIWTESKFKHYVVSTKGAIGLMQLMPKTAKDIVDELDIDQRSVNILESDNSKNTIESNNELNGNIDKVKLWLTQPSTNIFLGCAYYAKLLQAFNNNERLALAAYNAGSAKVREWISENSNKKLHGYNDTADNMSSVEIKYKETAEYIKSVQRVKRIYSNRI